MLANHLFHVHKMKPIILGAMGSTKYLFSTVKSSPLPHHFSTLAKCPKKQRTHASSSVAATAAAALKKKEHAMTWVWERITAVSLMGLLPASFFNPSLAMEGIACLMLASHLHWGLEAICTDYLRPAVVGKFIPKCIPVIVLVPIIVGIFGFAHIITTSKGVGHLITRIWLLKTTEELDEMK